MIEIQEAITDQDIEACFPPLLELRPHLVQNEFLNQIKAQQRQGYKLVYLRLNGRVTAALGYRISQFLAWGKVLYIDDLITSEVARGRGLAGKLLDYTIEVAKSQSCRQIHLDTGFHRFDAHRLYLNKGFKISCHHLELHLD
jgi:GNAT superfamily N-acetyltransferase